MAKRVLVTGGRGFTGHFMVAELKQAGYDVFYTATNVSDSDSCYKVDLQDISSLKEVCGKVKPDIVIHLAAMAFVAHADISAFYNVNLIGSRNLLEAVYASGHTPDCILLASSANIYGNQVSGLLNESCLPSPANDYAVSKLAMEYMAKIWQDKLPVVIARPFNYTGAGQAKNFVIPKIVEYFKKRSTAIELGNLDVWRDFSDVRDVVTAYRKLVETNPKKGVFNVASGRSYSLREIISYCEEITGHSIEVRVNPAFVRANEVKELRGDATKLRTLIGEFSHYNIKETLSWMLGQ